MACTVNENGAAKCFYRSSSDTDFQAFGNKIYRAICRKDYATADHFANFENLQEFLKINGIRLLLSIDRGQKIAQNWLVEKLKLYPNLITDQLFVQASVSSHIFSFLINNHFAVLRDDIVRNGTQNIKLCFENIHYRNSKQECKDLVAKLEKEENNDRNIIETIKIGKELIEAHVEIKLTPTKKHQTQQENQPTFEDVKELEIEIDDPIEDKKAINSFQKRQKLSLSDFQNEIKELVKNNDVSEENIKKIINCIINNDYDLNFYIDEEENTLVHFACRWVRLDLFEVLWSRGLDIPQPNIYGLLPLVLLAKGIKELTVSEYNEGIAIGKLIERMKSNTSGEDGKVSKKEAV